MVSEASATQRLAVVPQTGGLQEGIDMGEIADRYTGKRGADEVPLSDRENEVMANFEERISQGATK